MTVRLTVSSTGGSGGGGGGGGWGVRGIRKLQNRKEACIITAQNKIREPETALRLPENF